jgi:multisubunit Na+/H+ antiporter MnhG subunit
MNQTALSWVRAIVAFPFIIVAALAFLASLALLRWILAFRRWSFEDADREIDALFSD